MEAVLLALTSIFRMWLGGFFKVKTDTGGYFTKDHSLIRIVGNAPTGVKYVIGLVLAGLLSLGHLPIDLSDASRAAAAGLSFLLFWRLAGHGPMLVYPLGKDPDDWLLKLIEPEWKPRPSPWKWSNWTMIRLHIADRILHWHFKAMWAMSSGIRWHLYSAIRYGASGALIGYGLSFLGGEQLPWLLAGLSIGPFYAIAWKYRSKFDFQHYHVAEMPSGIAASVAIMLTF